MNCHGLDKFELKQLAEADNAQLDDLEVAYIKQYDSVANGYNQKSGGDRSSHSDETKQIIGIRTREGISKHIDNHRTYDSVKGLPMYCIRVNIKGSEGVAINDHPNCKRKSFTARKYGSLERAIEEMLKFYNNLQTHYVPPKSGDNLPKGIRKINNGYAVQKIISGKLHYKAFREADEEENLRSALAYLEQIMHGCSSTTKCRPATAESSQEQVAA